jgi:alkylmercury lyase
VRLTVTPERIVQLVPAAALVSFGVPDTSAACCDVRGAFCNHVHFFSGPVAGARWRAAHPEALLAVKDALAVAHQLAQTRYGPGAA